MMRAIKGQSDNRTRRHSDPETRGLSDVAPPRIPLFPCSRVSVSPWPGVVLICALAAVLIWAERGQAQADKIPAGVRRPLAQTRADDAVEIRRTAEEILASPEFRHLRRLRQDGETTEPGNDTEVRRESNSSRDGSGSKRRRGKAGETGGSGSTAESSGSSGDQAESQRRGSSLPAGIEGVSSVLGLLFHVLAWLVLAAVCGFIVFLVVRALQGSDRPVRNDETTDKDSREGEAEPMHAPGRIPADIYVNRSRQFAEEGRFREAVGQLLLGAMSHIERAGGIRFRRSLTPRDYLRAVRTQPDMYNSLRSIVRVYEPIGFGRRPATRDHFEHSLAQYEAGFHAVDSPEK